MRLLLDTNKKSYRYIVSPTAPSDLTLRLAQIWRVYILSIVNELSESNMLLIKTNDLYVANPNEDFG